MTRCDDLHDLLPGWAAGEEPPADAERHVAACAACAARLDARRREAQGLRAAWVAPEPPEALRARLAEVARPAAERGPRTLAWSTALAALAAVVLAGLLAARWREGDGGAATGASTGPLGHDPGSREAGAPAVAAAPDAAPGATRFWMPPPALRLDLARAANRPDLGTPGEALPAGGGVLHEAALWRPGRAVEVPAARVERAPAPPLLDEGAAVQRYVYGDAPFVAGPRTWQAAQLPGAREVVLGAPVVERLPRPPPERLAVVLRSPDGSLRAAVQARLEPTLAVGVLVPEALGRALALPQFEIPGGAVVEAGSKARAGQRCRVRLEVPGVLGGEQGLTVEGVALGPTPVDLAARASGHVALWWRGPRRVDQLIALDPAVVGGPPPLLGVEDVAARWEDNVLEPPEGGGGLLETPYAQGRVFGLGWQRREGREAYFEACVLLGGLDPGTTEVEVSEVEVAGRFPPGAVATLARVWAGPVAVPSAEAVSVGTVAADGTLRLFRRAGEEGEGLLLRVVAPDGRATLQPLQARALLGRLRLRLEADGGAALEHSDPDSRRAWEDQGLWNLRGPDGDAQRAALSGVIAFLAGVEPGQPPPPLAAPTPAVLELVTEPGLAARDVLPWLTFAVRDDVRLARVLWSSARDGAPLTWDPERARAWEAVRGRVAPGGLLHRVRLRSPSAAGGGLALTHVRTECEPAGLSSSAPAPVPLVLPSLLPAPDAPAAARAEALRLLREGLRPAAVPPGALLEVVVEDLPSLGVPADDLRLVLQAALEAGVAAVRFRGG